MTDSKYAELFDSLKEVSRRALAECPAPTPMIVGHPSTPLGNDVDPTKPMWYVADGVCGMAFVVLESGRTGFAQWLLKNGYGNKHWSYGRTKGVSLYDFPRFGFAEVGQSYEKNRFVAIRMAEHLRANGYDCWVDSRID